MQSAKVLLIHNTHGEKGGEDTVVEQEMSLLRSHGHSVELLEVNNDDIPFATATERIAAGIGTIWSRKGYRLIERAATAFKPDVAHVHNTFNFLSPSIYWALSRQRVPIVTTMHNFRTVCAQGGFLRNGKACFDCLGRVPWPGLLHRCYYTLPASAAVVGMQVVHRHVLNTFPGKVHAFVVPSQRGIQFFEQAGWPARRLFHKPHFASDPLTGGLNPISRRERSVLFVGRLSEEKGVRELLSAWSSVNTDWTLVIAGKGPLERNLMTAYAGLKNLDWRGWCSRSEVLDLMQRSRFVVVPSIWHEPFGMVALEALACGTPVLAADRGGLSDVVRHGQNGALFEPASEAIARIMEEVFAQTEEQWSAWAHHARETYLRDYLPEMNYRRLMEIYKAACDAARSE